MIENLSKKVLLIIMDGFGINRDNLKNAISEAKTPNLDTCFHHYPFTTLEAGGPSVGLPKGICGNSEVGHLNLGSGRPVRQDLVRINESIENNSFENMEKLQNLISYSKNNTKRIHLHGLLSDGGVHSHINHLKEIIRILKKHDDLEIYLHALCDGRDTPKESAIGYVEEISKETGFTFASLQGRSIGMDRDRRWEKIEKSYNTLTGKNGVSKLTPTNYIKSEYSQGRSDEFFEPVLFSKEGSIQNNDCIFFFNFRPDRAKQITQAFNDPKFLEFENPVRPGMFLCMSPYVPDELPELPILFDKEKIKLPLCEYLSNQDKKQFKIAETEKYAHVTYFFNGGAREPFPHEEWEMIPSPKEVKTYDEKPEMSASLVTESLIKAIESDRYDFHVVNFANCDMVGHTGNFEATLKAVEAVDHSVGELMGVCLKRNICVLLTADHGNADQMIYDDQSPHTSHSKYPVPFCVIHKKVKDSKLQPLHNDLALKDVAPTILKVMGLKQPDIFSGKSVF